MLIYLSLQVFTSVDISGGTGGIAGSVGNGTGNNGQSGNIGSSDISLII
jgi:hypothetical protein